MSSINFKVKTNQFPELIARHKVSFPNRKKDLHMADTIEIIDPFQATPAQATPAPAGPVPIPTVEMPQAPPVASNIVVAGHFPSLSDSLQDELNSHLQRAKDAVSQIVVATREKAEFLEALAEKARKDVEAEKHNISKLLGN